MQYREPGVLMWRGFTLAEFANQCFSTDLDYGKGRQMPVHYGSSKLNYPTVSSPIAYFFWNPNAYSLSIFKTGCYICIRLYRKLRYWQINSVKRLVSGYIITEVIGSESELISSAHITSSFLILTRFAWHWGCPDGKKVVVLTQSVVVQNTASSCSRCCICFEDG